ncbi:MAG: C-GCAxxG-C-C family protein [Anaerolineae bacterium]|nr:C-GCAxxG-C-C family protein [Anaerolineae bacterium]
MSVVDDSFDHPLKIEEHAAMPLAGGIMGNGYQCGMLWGGALAAGAQAYRLYGAGARAEVEALLAAQSLVSAFQARAKDINCAEITELEWKRPSGGQVVKFLARGGPIGCFRLAADYAQIAFDTINNALGGEHTDMPAQPVSCTALLAQKMGVSEMHAVMAAGLAGGIGLSGGACGVLGAAIWFRGINTLKDGGKLSFDLGASSPEMERFLASADYEFECASIVGRKFADVADHAAYVREGGCAKIIAALATRG